MPESIKPKLPDDSAAARTPGTPFSPLGGDDGGESFPKFRGWDAERKRAEDAARKGEE